MGLAPENELLPMTKGVHHRCRVLHCRAGAAMAAISGWRARQAVTQPRPGAVESHLSTASDALPPAHEALLARPDAGAQHHANVRHNFHRHTMARCRRRAAPHGDARAWALQSPPPTEAAFSAFQFRHHFISADLPTGRLNGVQSPRTLTATVSRTSSPWTGGHDGGHSSRAGISSPAGRRLTEQVLFDQAWRSRCPARGCGWGR
jgi:hypothetical protein